MKKKSLLLMLLMVLLVPWAVAQKSLPYSYGFEDNNLSVDGWTTQNPSGLNASEFGINASAAKTGSYGFRFSSYNDNGTSTQYLISPELTAPKGVTVSFYYKSSSTYSSGEKFKVGYSTTNTDVSSFSWSDEYSTSSTSWSQLPEFNCPAGTKYIAIYYYANYQYRLYIDDISLDVPPSCMKPTGLTATLTPGDGTIATLNWTAGGEETAWVLEYGTTSDFTGATSVNVSGTPTKNLKGLTAETKYYARVKADCGGGETSEWSATCEFTPTNVLYINIGGSSSSTTNYLPTQTNYDYSYTQQIYTAEEMGSFPCTLQSVAFKGNKAAVCDLDIYLANTTKSSFTGTSDYIAINEATPVFSGNVTFTANDWTTIEFDNEFDYEGGNLAVIVDDNSGNYAYGSTTWQAFNTTTAQALYFYQDNTDVNPSSPSANYSGTPSVKNQIKLGYALPSPYQKPKNLAVTNLTATSATITWEAPNSDVQSYKYQYREAGGSWSALTSTTALSAPLTVLTGNTTYEFQVQAIYAGNNESAFASTSFTTPCDAFSIDPTAYQYGFETADDMDCWETVDCEDDVSYNLSGRIYNATDNPYARGGVGGCFGFSSYNGNTEPQYLISPQLSGIAAGLHVEFYYRSIQDNDEETFEVGYSTTDKNITSFTWGTEVLSSGPDYNRFSANYPANVKYVAVKYTTADSYYLFVDDFTFEEAASCLEPTAVTASNITTNSADITWTNGGEETTWDIFVTSDNTVVPDETTTPTHEGITTKPYTLTLSPATTYYVYVRAACSAKETSAWSSPVSFNTDCEGMDLPYGPYGFEDGALTVCWNHYSDNLAYNSASVYNGSTYAHTGDNSLRFYRGSTAGDLVLALPVVDDSYDLSEYQFEFWAYASNTSMLMSVGIMDDPNDLTTFTTIESDFNPASTYTEYKVRFSNYTGSGKYVAIKVTRSGGSSGSIYMDDIAINPIPSCIEPSGLAVSDETGHGATFSWTNGGSETEWHLYVSTENNAPADDIDLGKVTVADSNPFSMIIGLDPETEYYVWVRANCGGTDGYSAWVGPETFTTTVACPAPTGLTASEVTNHTAKLSWTGTSESYNVWYRTAATMSNPIFSETFETSSLPTGWGRSSTALTDDVLNGTTTINSYSGGWVNTSYGLGQYNWKMNIYSTGKYWLITPSITLDAKNTLNFDAAITAYNSNNAPTSSNMADGNSRFVVLITTDNQATWTILREWNNTGSADVLNNISNTGNSFSIDLTAYAGETVKIAFYGGQTSSGPDCDLHIDNVVIGTPVEAGEWTKKTADASPYVATVLLAETKYEAQVQGNCGCEGTSQWSSSIFFTTDIACPAPTALAASNPTSSSFDISWNNGGASDWIVAYKKTTETDFTEISLNISDVTEEAGVISYTLGGLDDDTEYTVKVRDNCEPSYTGDGVSDWTAEVTYSTIAACSALNPVASNITHHTAKVDWDGESTSGYTVKYRESALVSTENPVFYEAFNTNSSTPPTGWTRYSGLVDAVIAGSTSLTTVTTGWYTNSAHALGSYNAKLNIYGVNCKYWLVTPEVVLTNGLSLSFDLALTDYNNSNVIEYPEQQPDDRFVVLVFADDAWHILREWNNSGSPYVYNTIATTGENVVLDLAAYAGKTIKVAFYGESTVAGASSGVDDNDLHIDNVLIGTSIPAGDWQTQAAATTTANLSGLTAGTMYDVKIVPNCDPTQESGIVNFTTLKSDKKYFLTAGEWETAANWMDGEIPTSSDDAVIRADVFITNSAEAKNVTFEGTPTPEITIEDGAEFVHNNAVNATYQKLVSGYGYQSNPGGWNFIASPVNSFSTNDMPAGPYDLYKYDEAAASWYSNTGEHPFTSLTRGIGYLYANQQDVTWNFTGSMIGTNTEVTKTLSFAYSHITDPDGVKGFNLMGNPYTRNLAYGDVTIDNVAMTAFLRLDNGDDYEVCDMYNGDEILPGQGFFYQVGATGKSMKFKKATAKDANEIGLISIVAGNDSKVDKAFVQIGGGNTLRKIAFSNSKSSVYVINDGDDYAAATIYELAGTMPVHFKAVAEGEYDITVSTKNLEATTLLLFDNFKNETIDLLETPTYHFKSSVDDQENRFKLIFDFNNNNNYNGVEDNFTNGNFVYQSGDELIVNGEGELQIFDVLGRLVTSKNISGIERVSKPAQTGVYIFRLNEHTQKIVIK